MQFSAQVLDSLIAPEFSTLSSFSLPEVPELPNFFISFFMNELFKHDRVDEARPLIFSMIRHLGRAIRDYREAVQALNEFSNALQHSNKSITAYVRALNHLEQTIIHCALSVGLSHAVVRSIDKKTPKEHFHSGDNSPEERLRLLYNALKHFDTTAIDGQLPDYAVPVWIVQNGLKCALEPKRGETPVTKALLFTELAEIFSDLASNAKFFAEEVYKIAHASRAAKEANSSA